MLKHICYVFLASLLFGSFAFAESSMGGHGIYFEENLFPVFVNRNDTGSITDSPGVATESGIGYDSRTTLGLVLGSHFLVGATYNTYHLQTKRDAVASGDSGLDETTEKNQFGPTIGWLGNNWRFLVTYFTTGKKTVDTKNFDSTATTGDVSIINTDGSGYQALLGYSFVISKSFAVGPSLVYRSVSYAKQSKVNRLNETENYEDVSLYSNSVESTLTGMLSLSFWF
jgi:hypothetical protein